MSPTFKTTQALPTLLHLLPHPLDQVLSDQPRQPHLWLRAAVDRDAGRPIDWDAIFGPGGYDAAVDWPAVTFWKVGPVVVSGSAGQPGGTTGNVC